MDAKHIQSSVAGVVEYLKKNPTAALSTDSTAVAVLEKGLRCRVEGPGGAVVTTDMPTAIGGEGLAPGPGWLLRAALASCDATMIAMRAAVEGVTLTELEVKVDSDSDDRGLVGADDAVPAGPLRVRVRVRIVSTAPAERLKEIIDWAERHSPVGDAVRRAVPISMKVETN
ncbi:MAG: OsmC family protein [Hyphomicrobiales bacterium]|nr:OsmC family protein [Hyphomicrobiales bacterium]